MSVDLNELIMIYTKANIEMSDIFEVTIPPGIKSMGGTTTEEVCGFVIPTKGKARFTIDKHSYELKPGVILHAGAGIQLDKEVLGGSEWKYILLHYKVVGDTRLKNILESQNFILPIENYGSMELEILLQKLIRLRDDRSPINRFKTKTLIYSVFENILQFAWQATIGTKEESLDHILEYIHSNMNQNLSVSHLAEMLNMDSKQFHYLFQKKIGTCPKKYLIQFKMDRAKELLKDVNYSITSVASMVGYDDPLHFSRIFKKNTGHSPSAFRENLEKNPWRI
ncbi:MAG: hypothetical protein K0S61_3629 [Anaerocolumna sp.]|nr:hypothetical protein [Anaerocolumna sp.]